MLTHNWVILETWVAVLLIVAGAGVIFSLAWFIAKRRASREVFDLIDQALDYVRAYLARQFSEEDLISLAEYVYDRFKMDNPNFTKKQWVAMCLRIFMNKKGDEVHAYE